MVQNDGKLHKYHHYGACASSFNFCLSTNSDVRVQRLIMIVAVVVEDLNHDNLIVARFF